MIYFLASNTCPNGWFLCSNNQCILLNLRCDGYRHCSSGDDEKNCCEFNCFCIMVIMIEKSLWIIKQKSLSHNQCLKQGFQIGGPWTKSSKQYLVLWPMSCYLGDEQIRYSVFVIQLITNKTHVPVVFNLFVSVAHF